MSFPLPLDPQYRKEIIWAWIGDIADRIEEDLPGAGISWGIAQEIYLSLPPGNGDEEIESALWQARVKLDQTLTRNQ
jgi:hypothetical protein